MNRVRKSNDRLDGVIPYDAKNIPVEVFLSANENPHDVPAALKREISERIERLSFNRYPDSLARTLRDLIAAECGLDPACVLMGNGGDEHLMNVFLAWGGPGRTCLNMPPTFSVYEANAHLTDTNVVNVKRREDFSIDEEAVLTRVAQGDIDLVIVPSPNNPTGQNAPFDFIGKLLETTDALVLVDEAYYEFSSVSARPYLETHENLLILRTFSKAYRLAGVRMGYVLGSESVIREFLKVRQPYSVDAVSQIIAEVVFENRAQLAPVIDEIVANRAMLTERLARLHNVKAYQSDSNYILFKVPDAHSVWKTLLEEYSVLVRDFSSSNYLQDCLRVTVGTREENERFLAALAHIVG